MTGPDSAPVTLDHVQQLLLSNQTNAPDVADSLYKRINQLLDERVEHHRHKFAEQGTTDFDAISFVFAANFIHHNVDPEVIATLLIASIYRLARLP